MLREFRVGDISSFIQLQKASFPEEEALQGTVPSEMERVIRRIYRWDYRLVLGLLRAVGRPVYRLYVIEEGGLLAATALLTYPKGAGYVSSVAVDPQFRRRGFGRRVVQACLEGARVRGRRYLVLDVLVDNAAARALYDGMGFEPLREIRYMVRSAPEAERTIRPELPKRAREFRKSDGPALAKVARRDVPEAVDRVLPIGPGEFSVPPVVTAGLGGETRAWVIDVGRGAEAFVRATVGPVMTAGNVTSPVVGPGVSDEAAAALVAHAVGWVASLGHPRVMTQVPSYNTRGRAALEGAGFSPSLPLLGLYRSTGA